MCACHIYHTRIHIQTHICTYAGKNALILGYGEVGSRVACVLLALGVNVSATRASAKKVCMYVYVYACMYMWMYVCMCMYVCMYKNEMCQQRGLLLKRYVCMYVCIHACYK